MTETKKIKNYNMRHKKIKSNLNDMEKVKIKRVKRQHKKISTQEKILAGIGVGSTLLGGAGVVAPKTGQTQFVRTMDKQSAGKTTGRIKSLLKNVFGIKGAAAATPEETRDAALAEAQATKDQRMSDLDTWRTQADADADAWLAQDPENPDAQKRKADIQTAYDEEVQNITDSYNAAVVTIQQAYQQAIAQQGPQVGEERTNAEGFTEVYDGSGWRLKDGQTKVILGIVYTTQNGVWVEQQQGGQTQAPKEGDTKTENDLTYTYKNGQWVMDAGQRVQNPNTFWYLSDGQGGWTLEDGQTKTEGGIIYKSQGGEWVEQQQQQGPQVGEERTNAEGFTEVYDGSGWRLKDGQTKVILGIVYTTQNGVWVEQQSSGGAVAHTYTITTGAPAVSVDVNSGAGMTYEIRDETGQLVNMAVGVGPSFSVSNPSVARVNAVPGTVEIIGVSEGTATVTINYAGASATFEVTVNALPGSGDQGGGGAVAHTYTISTGASSVSVDAGSGAGMTYEIRDETGQLVNMAVGVGPSFSVSNPSVARVNAVPGTVEIIGVSEGTATVTINYAGASATFEVTVNALPGSGDQGGGDTGGAAALNISVPSISGVTAGQYQEFPFQATGGSGGYVWEKVSGPDWLLMDPNTGILYTENMPADLITGTVSVTVRVSDGSASAQKVFSISVYAPAQGGQTSGFSVGVSQGTLSARSGNYTEFANVLQVSGGSGSYAYSIAMADGSMLPAGIGIGETGIIYANDNTFGQAPVPAGSYMLTVGVVDLGSGETKNIILNLQVQPSGTQTPPSQTAVSVNFSKADGSSAANLKVGESWKIVITGAKAGVQVTAGTIQTLPNGQKKAGVRVLGTTDSQGRLEVSDTVLAEHVGTWSMRLKVDGQDTGTVLNFSITAQGQTAAAPVGPDGKLREGWVQDGTRYFNSSLGLYSNKDGRFQSRTSDGYAALLKADALSKFSPVYMTDVYTWNAWYQNPDGTMGRIENARNSYYYATLETASKLASLLGGTVETTYFGSGGGPFVDVLGKKAPKTQADLAPMYMIKINGVSNPAGLIALDLTNSYGLMPFEDLIAQMKTGRSVWDAIAEQALKTTDAAGTTVTPDAIKNIISQFKGTPPTVTANSFMKNLKMVDIYGHNEPVNSSHYATLEAVQAMAKYLGGTVGQIDNSSPFSKVVDASGKTIVQYTIVIGNYTGNAGLILNTYKNNPKSVADSMIATEILMANNSEIYASLYGSPAASSASVNTALTISAVINKAANHPWTSFSDAEKQLFNTYFANGQNRDKIPTSFKVGSVFAQAFNLGDGSNGTTSVILSDGSIHGLNNGVWTLQTGSGANTAVQFSVNSPTITQLSTTSVTRAQLSQNYRMAIVGSNFNAVLEKNSVEIINSSGAVVGRIASNIVLQQGIIFTLPGNLSVGSYKIQVRNLDNATKVSNQLSFSVIENSAASDDLDLTGGGSNTGRGSNTSGGLSYSTVRDASNAGGGGSSGAGVGGSDRTNTGGGSNTDSTRANTGGGGSNSAGLSYDTVRNASNTSGGSNTGGGGGSNVGGGSGSGGSDRLNTGGGGGVNSGRGGGPAPGEGGRVSIMGSVDSQPFQGLRMPTGLQYQAPEEEAQVQGASTVGTYTVKKGDSLWKIAKKHYGDGKKWRKILEANTDKVKNPKAMKVGIELVIPNL